MKKHNTLLVLSTAFIIASLVLFYYYIGRNGFSNDPTHWGVFGDYFGGIIGTVISTVTLYFVYLTYTNQTKILIQTQFETSFFSLLNHQKDILNSLSGKARPNNVIRGSLYVSHISKLLETNVLDPYYESMYEAERGEFYLCNIQKNIDKEFEYCYESLNNHQLSSYFRHLYNILKFVDSSNVDGKQTYCNILFAQLTDDELLVNFYNCISDRGYDKYLPLAHKYSMFENMYSRGKTFEKQAKLFFPKTQFKDENQQNSRFTSSYFSIYTFEDMLKKISDRGCNVYLLIEMPNKDYYERASIVLEVFDELAKNYFVCNNECNFRGTGAGYSCTEDLFKSLEEYNKKYIHIHISFIEIEKIDIIMKGTKFVKKILDESESLYRYQNKIDANLKARIDSLINEHNLDRYSGTPFYH